MALAASGGVLSGILFDRLVKPVSPVVPQLSDTTGKLRLIPALTLVAVFTVGAMAIHLILKVFKIKIFNKVIR